MDFELKTLLDEFGFTAEERTQAEVLFTPRQDKAKKLFMAQANYSREMDKLKKNENALNAEFTRIAEYEASLGKAIGVEDVNQVAPRLNSLIVEHRDAVARATALEVELRKQANDFGFTPTIPVAGTGGGAGGGRQDIDTSRFLTKDALNVELQDYPLLPAALHDLGVKHQKLFGVPLEDTSELTVLAMQSAREAAKYKDPSRQRSVEQIWEEKFNVPAKRAEVAAVNKEAEFQTRLQEEKIKWGSQSQNSSVPNSGIPGSPILSREFKPVVPAGTNPVVNAGNGGRGVDAALKNFGNYYGGQSQ